MNFYRISNFSAKITKKSLKILFICVTGFADSPLELLFLLTGVLGPVRGGGTALTGQNPAKGGIGGEGDLGEKEEEAEPHP